MQAEDRRALSRRAFVGKISRGAAGAALALSVAARASSAVQHPVEQGAAGTLGPENTSDLGLLEAEANRLGSSELKASEPAPWTLLAPLTVGSAVGEGWQMVDLSGAIDGSCVATLENDKGRSQRLHICRNGGTPQGLVYTDRFDLVAMNGGRGDLPTEESFGQAVAAIAHVIAGNEAKHDELMRKLLPQSEREEHFASTARLR